MNILRFTPRYTSPFSKRDIGNSLNIRQLSPKLIYPSYLSSQVKSHSDRFGFCIFSMIIKSLDFTTNMLVSVKNLKIGNLE